MTSTRLLMRGNSSPRRTRRNSASDDGRVFVGSIPTRLYIDRTAAVTSADSAPSAHGRRRLTQGLVHGARHGRTTRTPSTTNHPGRTNGQRLRDHVA